MKFQLEIKKNSYEPLRWNACKFRCKIMLGWFLVAVLSVNVLIGACIAMPVFMLLMFMGNYGRKSYIRFWECVPILKGINPYTQLPEGKQISISRFQVWLTLSPSCPFCRKLPTSSSLVSVCATWSTFCRRKVSRGIVAFSPRREAGAFGNGSSGRTITRNAVSKWTRRIVTFWSGPAR